MKLFKANDYHRKVLVPEHVASVYPWDIMRWRSTDTDPGMRVEIVGGKELELRYETTYERDADYNTLMKLLEDV